MDVLHPLNYNLPQKYYKKGSISLISVRIPFQNFLYIIMFRVNFINLKYIIMVRLKIMFNKEIKERPLYNPLF